MTALLRFAKGHGTGNDFVLLPDPEGHLDLTAATVRRLCDRHRGVGADGVLRVVRTSALADGAAYLGDAEWFMDYRNADGTVAEMCGNGVRVFARYLAQEGLTVGETVPVATRGGVKMVVHEADGSLSVDMGSAVESGTSTAVVNGVSLTGRVVSMGNPHLVCGLGATTLTLPALELHRPPEYDAVVFPDGVNVELVVPAAPADGYDAAVAMRVHERGVGETQSCGTGVCAVAYAALADLGLDAGRVLVDVPGGRLHVEVAPDRVVLRGPAVVLARGEVDLDSLV